MKRSVKSKTETPRCCKLCGQPERSDGFFTTIAKHLGICADCINRAIKERR